MSIRPFILGLALAAPLFAQAGYSINTSAFSCSAALSFANSTGLDAHCTGNFSVTGGTWTSDTQIALSADGSLTLDGVTMTAPIIELLSPQIWVNASLDTSGGTVHLEAQRDLIIRTTPDQNRPVGVQGGGGAVIVARGGQLEVSAGGRTGDPVEGVSCFNCTQKLTGGEILIVGDWPTLDVASSTITSLPTPYTITVSTIPEPESYALALAALAILGSSAALAHRRKA